MAIQVTVTDTDTDESETCTIEDNYVLITAGTCYVAHTNLHANGTHVITVKGRREGQAAAATSAQVGA